jgi:HEAT repeat protein
MQRYRLGILVRTLVLSLCLLMAGGSFLFWQYQQQPAVQGRLLRDWMIDLGSPDPQKRGEASNAIQLAGTNGVPLYLRLLATGPAAPLRWLTQLAPSLPGLLRIPLFRLLRPYENDYFRSCAAMALGLSGPAGAAAIPVLKTSLNDPSPYIRMRSMGALAAMGREGAIALGDSLASANSEQSMQILSMLTLTGTNIASAAPTLVRVAEGEDPALAASALRALGQAGPPAVPTILSSIVSASGSPRTNLFRALNSVASASFDGLKSVTNALLHSSSQVRIYVCLSMGPEIPWKGLVLRALNLALQDPDPQVRLSALQAIDGLGPLPARAPQVLTHIPQLLDDPVESIRIAAREVFRRLQSVDPKEHSPTQSRSTNS